MRARRARAADVPAIHALIAKYAAQGLLLPRTEKDVRAHVGRFLVLAEKEQILGCVALEPYGPDLAEVRSLAVDGETRGRGLGARLIQYALSEARRRRMARLFAVTHAPDFFVRHGFAATERQEIPEKLERDCHGCPKRDTCHLVAVVMTVCPERDALPVLTSAAPA